MCSEASCTTCTMMYYCVFTHTNSISRVYHTNNLPGGGFAPTARWYPRCFKGWSHKSQRTREWLTFEEELSWWHQPHTKLTVTRCPLPSFNTLHFPSLLGSPPALALTWFMYRREPSFFNGSKNFGDNCKSVTSDFNTFAHRGPPARSAAGAGGLSSWIFFVVCPLASCLNVSPVVCAHHQKKIKNKK